MNYWVIVAGLTLLLVAGVHSWLGERRVLGPLLAPGKATGPLAEKEGLRRLLRGAWHFTSVTWFANGLALLALAPAPLDPGAVRVAGIFAALYAGFGIYLLVSYRGRHPGAPFFLVAGA